MTTYIDDMYLSPLGSYGRMKMSHMVADTHEELMAMAKAIGVGAKWLQKPGTPAEHFDVCMAMRERAVFYGAVEISMRELAAKINEKRLQVAKVDA